MFLNYSQTNTRKCVVHFGVCVPENYIHFSTIHGRTMTNVPVHQCSMHLREREIENEFNPYRQGYQTSKHSIKSNLVTHI